MKNPTRIVSRFAGTLGAMGLAILSSWSFATGTANTFFEVTVRPGSSVICTSDPCTVYFETPAGSGTHNILQNGTVNAGVAVGGQRVSLGVFPTRTWCSMLKIQTFPRHTSLCFAARKCGVFETKRLKARSLGRLVAESAISAKKPPPRAASLFRRDEQTQHYSAVRVSISSPPSALWQAMQPADAPLPTRPAKRTLGIFIISPAGVYLAQNQSRFSVSYPASRLNITVTPQAGIKNARGSWVVVTLG